MDNEKIKKLRSRIAIGLDVAIKLLKKNNGDVDASEQAFHHDNIIEISIVAECDYEEAKESYNHCKYDIVKAIDRIDFKQVIITTRENKIPRREVGFIIWPDNNEWNGYKTKKRNDAFIPTADFDYIIEEFESVYPLKNPRNKDMENSFDICGHNFFDNKTFRLIVERIKDIKSNDPKVEKFLKEAIDWFEDKLKYAEYMVVYGNQ